MNHQPYSQSLMVRSGTITLYPGHGHGGYPVNRIVRYGSHNMADAMKQLWLLRNHVACSGLFSYWYQ